MFLLGVFFVSRKEVKQMKEVINIPTVEWMIAGGLMVLGIIAAIKYARGWWEKKVYGDPQEIISIGPTGPQK